LLLELEAEVEPEPELLLETFFAGAASFLGGSTFLGSSFFDAAFAGVASFFGGSAFFGSSFFGASFLGASPPVLPLAAALIASIHFLRSSSLLVARVRLPGLLILMKKSFLFFLPSDAVAPSMLMVLGFLSCSLSFL